MMAVAHLTDLLHSAEAVVVLSIEGLPASALNDLRRRLGAGGKLKVVKNSLIERAAKESGLEALCVLFYGSTAMLFLDNDWHRVAKVLLTLSAHETRVQVKGALVEGVLLDSVGFRSVAELPVRNDLLSYQLSLFRSTITLPIYTTTAIVRGFLNALRAEIERHRLNEYENEIPFNASTHAESSDSSSDRREF